MDHEAGVKIYKDPVFYYLSRIGGVEQSTAYSLIEEGKLRPDQRDSTTAEIQNNLAERDDIIRISNHLIECEYDIVEVR